MNWDTIGQIFSGGINAGSLLDTATSNWNGVQTSGPTDGAGTDAIKDTNIYLDNDIELDNDPTEEYSEDTVKMQNELISDGYGEYLGDSQADGFLGKKTRYAMKKRDQDKANTLLSSIESNRLKNYDGRGGVASDDEGYMTPVYASPKFNNRFS